VGPATCAFPDSVGVPTTPRRGRYRSPGMRWLPLVLLVWTGLAWLGEPPALVAASPPASGDALVLQLSDAPLPPAPDRVLQSGDAAGRTAALPSEPVTLPVLVTK